MSSVWCSFFSAEATVETRIFYTVLAAVVFIYTTIALLSPLLTPECKIPVPRAHVNGSFPLDPNPSYRHDPCRWLRYAELLGLNKWEADMCCRIVMSIAMGSIIGFERRRADRPAGVRTMAMVCLGSCVFSIDSMFAFVDGTMGWDSSRVSAAIPSGVGFLGAASIWKGPANSKDGGVTTPEIHGLTTATSVWLSAAVGLLCGGGLYIPSFFATASGVVFLRFAPGSFLASDGEPESEPTTEAVDLEALAAPLNLDESSKRSVGPLLVQLPSSSRQASMKSMKSSVSGSPRRQRASIYS
ncbi:hypothetical protein AB1Y20_018059 [Prymnesium parvum]|uniref:MgtC/SapB/SrpB/YhiD N-terminal domain-containing protein n=1 Tax=Prymnesium parvum TaxID=97485 RepID=A0AB34JMD7_PRYPA